MKNKIFGAIVVLLLVAQVAFARLPLYIQGSGNITGNLSVTGNVGIGTYNPATALDVNGNVTGDWFFGNVNASYVQNAPWMMTSTSTTSNVNINAANIYLNASDIHLNATGSGLWFYTGPFNVDTTTDMVFQSGGDVYINGSDVFINGSGSGVFIDGGEYGVTLNKLAAEELMEPLDCADQAFTNVDIDSGAIDGTPIGGGTPAAVDATTLGATGDVTLGSDAADAINFNGDTVGDITPNVDGTDDLGSATNEFQDLHIDGTANIDALVADTADINGGTVDGAIIGGATPAAVDATTLGATGNVDLGDNAADTITATGTFDSAITPATDDTYDLGTSSAEWQDLFIDGTANIDSAVLDTADINGGTADGVTIGGSTPAAATVTDLTSNGNTVIGSDGTDTLTIAAVTTFNDNNADADTITFGDVDDLDNIDVKGDANVDGTLTVGSFSPTSISTGDLTATGNVQLGDAADDNIVANGEFTTAIVPNTDDDVDIGSSSQEWQDLFIDGTGNIDSLVADTADINAGTIDGATIGGATPAAVDATTLGSSGAATLNSVVSSDVAAATDAALTLEADLGVVIELDADGDGTNEFEIKNGAGTQVFKTDESGNTQQDGNSDVDGGLDVAGNTLLNGDVDLGSGDDTININDALGTGLDMGANSITNANDVSSTTAQTSGAATLNSVVSSDVAAATDAALTLEADLGVVIELDADNDGANVFEIKDGAGTQVFKTDESGNTQQDGNSDVDGTLDVAGTATFAGTLDANGAVTLGDNGETIIFDSSDWDIDATGDMTGIGAITSDGDFTTKSGDVIVMNGAGTERLGDIIGILGDTAGAIAVYNGGIETASMSGATGFTGEGSGLSNVDATTVDGIDGANIIETDGSKAISGGQQITMTSGTGGFIKGQDGTGSVATQMDGDSFDVTDTTLGGVAVTLDSTGVTVNDAATGSPTITLEQDGTGTFVKTVITGGDVAEDFEDKHGNLEVGDVVVITDGVERVERSKKAYDTMVAGIVSSNETIAVHMGEGKTLKNRVPLALNGVVYAKASTENGLIKPGDLLTTSLTPGHVMKCERPSKCFGSLVGKALERLDNPKGKIKMLVALH